MLALLQSAARQALKMRQDSKMANKISNPFLSIPEYILARYDHLVLHCAATHIGMDVDAEWADRVHRNKGWRNGNGYHGFIKLDGTIQLHSYGDPCRPLHKPGAHVGDCGPGWNTRSLGVCYAGGVDINNRPMDTRTDAQRASQKQIVRWFLEAHPEPWKVTVCGHRDIIAKTGAPPKACPSFDVEDWVKADNVLKDFDFQGDMEDVNGGSPALQIPEYHTVRKGETYWDIAKAYGLNLTRVVSINYIRPEKLQPGDKIRLRR